jgi:peroxiredoxin
MKYWSNKLASLALVAVSFCFASNNAVAELINEPAPDFTLKAKSGENMRLKELSGDVVLVNFWASWCGPCRKEMPLLQKLQDKYKDMGFTVLGVNVEEQNDAAKNFIDEVGVSFPILLDEANDVSKLYDVNAMPTTVIIDRQGNKRYVHYGFQSGDEAIYKKVVKALVRE